MNSLNSVTKIFDSVKGLTRDKLVIEGKMISAGPISNLNEASVFLDLPSTCQEGDPTNNMLLFLRTHFPYSSLHMSNFTIDNVQYNSVEQYLQSSKAAIFDDDCLHAQIMKETNPYKIKNLGNRVKKFSNEKWQ